MSNRVLAFDPGAKRMGIAVLDEGPTYVHSDVQGIDRGKEETYQNYRVRLIHYWAIETMHLLISWEPDIVVNEIVPVKGGGSFIGAAQSQLAATAITTVQAVASHQGYKLAQIGATTVKATVAGSGKASKIVVRNKVWEVFPQLKTRTSEWTIDESDALAVALSYLSSL